MHIWNGTPVVADLDRFALPVDCTPNDASECAICLEPLNGNELAASLICAHKFHARCVSKWLNTVRHPTCPLCQLRLDMFA